MGRLYGIEQSIIAGGWHSANQVAHGRGRRGGGRNAERLLKLGHQRVDQHHSHHAHADLGTSDDHTEHGRDAEYLDHSPRSTEHHHLSAGRADPDDDSPHTFWQHDLDDDRLDDGMHGARGLGIDRRHAGGGLVIGLPADVL